ncbi:LexA family transcriptional regulator [Serratia sp. Ag1]|uniref:LexA family protein n=1 Tax=Serratia sp. Ag1 TaxID=1524467 RepID=UPI000508B55E|nr:LexA family transcriptional regulator [Serratia sp. Ag1]KFK98107.1 hypothetical protein IV04_14525 [Serratia sp. Ag1]
MTSLAERLMQRRLELNLSQEDLARMAGVSRMAISKIEMGLTQNPRADNLFTLAKALRCSPYWLQTGKTDTTDGFPSQDLTRPRVETQTYSYPKISWVNAGNWSEAIELDNKFNTEDWISTCKNAGGNAFWLDVKGDSMTAPSGLSITEGMSILVNPDAEVLPGKLVVARLLDSNEATFKKYIEDSGKRYLKPLNPQYPLIEINGNCEIIGVVVEARIEF